ncbi:hypothetical protein [uncultured Robinsoniella sp.]|uniref:hypothetical protein n=1 Tax=uncultured Robinsoniella sp. TaxID=904190 RepID=UPI00374F1933
MNLDKHIILKCGVLFLLKLAVFLGIALVLLTGASQVLKPKDNTPASGIKEPETRAVYTERDHSLDVIAIGNSDIYAAYTPMQLWKDYGLASYVCGEPGQRVYEAYYLLKSILERQSPKVVVYETDEIFQNGSPAKEREKVIFAGLADKFPVFQYHNRWKMLKPEDFTGKVKYTFDNFWKGFRYTDRVDAYFGKPYMRKRKKNTKLDPIPKYYLDKMVGLCREKGAELLFVEVPSANSWNYKRHNTVAQYARENKIPFLDLNKPGREYKVDWAFDTRDKGDHMNYNGARKVTAYLGKYLKENYNLPDRRKESAYADWNVDLRKYEKAIQNPGVQTG